MVWRPICSTSLCFSDTSRRDRRECPLRAELVIDRRSGREFACRWMYRRRDSVPYTRTRGESGNDVVLHSSGEIMRRFHLGSFVVAFCGLLGGAWPAQAAVEGDFNGDGFDDLAVGVPSRTSGRRRRRRGQRALRLGLGADRRRATSSGTRTAPASSSAPRQATSSAAPSRSATSTATASTTWRSAFPARDVGCASADAGAVNVLYGSPARA